MRQRMVHPFGGNRRNMNLGGARSQKLTSCYYIWQLAIVGQVPTTSGQSKLNRHQAASRGWFNRIRRVATTMCTRSNTCGSAGPREFTRQIGWRSVLPFLQSPVWQTQRHTDKGTTERTTCVAIGGNYAMHAMRPKREGRLSGLFCAWIRHCYAPSIEVTNYHNVANYLSRQISRPRPM